MESNSITRRDVLQSFHKQINAIVAKTLDSIEQNEAFHLLHPSDLDALRRKIFDIAWESYKVGYSARKRLEDYEGI